MKRRRILVALFFSFVFLCLSLTNVTADTADKNLVSSNQSDNGYTIVYCSVWREDGKVKTATYHLSKDELRDLNNIIARVVKRLQTCKGNVEDAVREACRGCKASFWILEFLRDIIKPAQKRVFVVSNGFGKRFDIELEGELKVYKPFTFWHYYGGRNFIKRSTTIIIDPFLPKIRVFNGWQLGIMRRFVGLYIHIPGSMLRRDHTFFMGYAGKVRVLDLPDPMG